MNEPIFHPKNKGTRQRALYTRIHRLKTDKHRGVWRNRGIEKIQTRHYPDLYTLTRRVTDFEV